MPKSRKTVAMPLLNRELGILAFNERVLAQAADERMPHLERLRFVCIVGSNLDEFFEIRFAGLVEQALSDPGHREADGLPVSQVIGAVQQRVRDMVARQYQLLNRTILPALQAAGVNFMFRPDWSPQLETWGRRYFDDQVLPILTPIGLDPAHPFPRVLNKSLNIAVELEGRDAFGRDAKLAIVQAPRVLPRLIGLPADRFGANAFILLSTLLIRFIGELFPGLAVRACHPFRVTRNSDLFVDEEEVTNLKLALQGELEAHDGALALLSPVERLVCGDAAHVLQVGGAAPMEMAARIVVNAAGLWAPGLAARFDGLAARHVPQARYAKGSYFALAGRVPFSHLIYPVPEDAGLGVHLTLDLSGQARFGPDVEWIDPASPDTIDYRVDAQRAPAFEDDIRRYWPGLPKGALQPAYSGVRPKLQSPGEPAHDFVVQGPADHGVRGLINLYGIESPGLTASLALADEVLSRLAPSL